MPSLGGGGDYGGDDVSGGAGGGAPGGDGGDNLADPTQAEERRRRAEEKRLAQEAEAKRRRLEQEAAFQDPSLAGTREAIAGRQAGLEGPTTGTENQQFLIDALKSRMAGEAPSVAELQLRRTRDRNVQDVMGMAGSARGGVNPALLQRQALQTGGAIGQEAAGQAAVLRAGEQAQAEQAMQAAVGTQQQVENQRAQLIQQYQALGMTAEQAQFAANQRLEEMRVETEQREADRAAGVTSARESRQSDVAGAGIGGLAALLPFLFSDKRLKEKITPGTKAVRAVMERLQPYSFEYKNAGKPGTARGPVVGVMAQDLQKSPLGRDMVTESKDGLQVDAVKAISAALAGNADLHHRVKALEHRRA